MTSRPGPGPVPARVPDSLLKAHAAAATIEEAIDLCVTRAMDAAGTPGASVAVMLDGEVFYERGYGVKHRLQGGAVDADTIFRIGSVTKQLTAAGVMQQVEAGTVHLDDPVTHHVPELALAGHIPAGRITVRHLLTHTSGYPDLAFDLAGPVDDGALAAWAADQGDVVLHAPPGVFWNYSNPNFNLAGLVLERASGVPYRRYLSERVFGPAGMERTTFDPAEVLADGNYAYGHMPSVIGETIYAPDDYDNTAFAPAGYAFSTAGDLVRWASTLIVGGGGVLTPRSAAEMQSRQADLELVPGYAYGHGIFVEPFGDLVLRQHGGNIPGWGAYLVWERTHAFAADVLANTFESLPGAAYCIADLLLPRRPVDPPPDPTDPADWPRLEGSWDFLTWYSYPLIGEILPGSDDGLLLYLWDPESSWFEWFELQHVGYGIFLVDLDGDGESESDMTFLDRGHPERVSWLRNRSIVGAPHRSPRPAEPGRLP